jgi:hypothetical protein
MAMCFRDKTYCAAECANAACSRQFTKAEQEAAERWWGGPGAPVSWADMSVGCADYQPVEQNP